MKNSYSSQISARKRIFFNLCQNKNNQQYILEQIKKAESQNTKSQCYWTDEEEYVSAR